MRGLRVGLRGRVSVAFALGSLAVSVLLAVATHVVASSYLLDQRVQTALRQAVFNARVVDDALRTTRPALEDLLEQLASSSGESSAPLAMVGGRWYDERFPPGREALPDPFVAAAVAGRPVRQRVQTSEGLGLAIALPLESSDAVYVEVFDLDELDRTLTALSATFAGTATTTTLLGLLLGLWASRRSLQPLQTVAAAAGKVARGDLSTRLDVAGDPDLVDLADAFNQTTERLERRVERDSRFAANVSHELRSPLTTMVNAVQLLALRADRLDEEGQEVLAMLTGEVQRLTRMVNDLLEISRPATAPAPVEPVHVATLVRLVADRCAGRPVTVVEPGAEQLVCLGDKRRLEQVVVNLVNNAETHGRGVRVVRVERGRDVLRIAVEDQGPGVPREDRELIFERFSRGPQRGGRAAEGVGLGLALVREHVRVLSGRVWVDELRGGGARFVVELPAQPVRAEPVPAERA